MSGVSKEEAAAALGEADRSHQRASALHAYRMNAPLVMLWGLMWIAADLTIAYGPHPWAGRWAWPLTSLIGSILSGAYMWRRAPGPRRLTERAGSRSYFWRMIATWALNFTFIVLAFLVIGPMGWREPHVLWGLFIALLYAVSGLWMGARLTILGIGLAALVMFAFYNLEGRPFLAFMGLVCGGSMILGGLWLRKA